MVFDLVIETHILSVIPKLIQINVIPCNIFITVPGRFAPNPVRPLSHFAPIPFSPWVVLPSFIISALKNEIWKIPLQIFVFWML